MSDEPDKDLSTAPSLLHHWRQLVDRVGADLKADAVTGLIAVRCLLQPPMLRLTHEASVGLRGDIPRRLREGLRPADRVLAVGHWEWLVVMPDLRSSTPVVLAMLKIQRVIDEARFRLPVTHDLLAFALGASIHPDLGDDPQHLIQSARIAALVAEQRPERYALYESAMDSGSGVGEPRLEDLKIALKANQLRLYLQPQVELASGRCNHAEALLRWCLPDGSMVPAPDAIAMVEQGGLRPRFNRWLVQQGVQTVARLEEAGVAIDVGINLTANDLLDRELPDLVEQTLALWDVPPSRVLFEITETIVVSDTADVADTLARLRLLGVRLAIDDFGTGYAGMSYLSRLPVNEVKIDQSFVRRVNESPTDYEIIASVTALAHRIGMAVIAEGVENNEVLEAIRRLGCDRVQGYIFSRPLPEDEFIEWWLQRHGETPRPLTQSD
jgi:EAL domain-containing protein (putative c-di-GMP-specific phosphodiesterase class I)